MIKQSDLDFAASELAGRLANYSPQGRTKLLVAYFVEIELMAGAALKENLDKTDSFADRLKYHTRRALANAYFDTKIRGAVSDAAAKENYHENYKPQQQVHVRHILVATEAEAKDVTERLKKGEDFAALASQKSKDSSKGGDLGFMLAGRRLSPSRMQPSDLRWVRSPNRYNRSSAGMSSKSRRNAISRLLSR